MIGIVILAHGTLGEALIRSASHVIGRRPLALLSLGMTASDDLDVIERRAHELVQQVDQGDGVLVLTDILGATPANIATRMVQSEHIEAVAGVNLPMLVRALTYRGERLAVVVDKAVSGGHEGVERIVPEATHAARGS
jgi:mannose PTS system EIIA component